MNFGNRVALISDVHGEHRLLRKVLERCRDDGIDSLVLLGDLFDRLDQAERCARYLAEWPGAVGGVIGNHEREALESRLRMNERVAQRTQRLLMNLGDHLVTEEAVFIHDELGWNDGGLRNGHGRRPPWITFVGHTHVRAARDDNGPLDIAMGWIPLKANRRYLINPGAVADGHYAIWDRAYTIVQFERVQR